MSVRWNLSKTIKHGAHQPDPPPLCLLLVLGLGSTTYHSIVPSTFFFGRGLVFISLYRADSYPFAFTHARCIMYLPPQLAYMPGISFPLVHPLVHPQTHSSIHSSPTHIFFCGREKRGRATLWPCYSTYGRHVFQLLGYLFILFYPWL